MPITDLNKVGKDVERIRDKYTFTEMLELQRWLTSLVERKHEEILKHQREQNAKL